jgi:four helix bundle protein
MLPAKRFDELISWQRMHELDVEVTKIAERLPIARDFKFSDQITDAANSAARNVAEGFARFYPDEFARFLDFSRGSATEVRTCLRKAHPAGYVSEQESHRLDLLARRGLALWPACNAICARHGRDGTRSYSATRTLRTLRTTNSLTT